MFKSVSFSNKTPLFILAALNMPIEIGANENKCWTVDVLKQLTVEMEIDEAFVDAYLPTILKDSYECVNVQQRRDQIFHMFPTMLQPNTKFSIFINVFMFIVVNNFHDARGRELLRNFHDTLGISGREYISIDAQLCRSLVAYHNDISTQKTDGKSKNSKMIRYAKIGAVALGAGAALALTGGLAAPAIAGAFLVMGSSSVAAVASVTAIATVFGTTGAGLSGYKMLRRTRGLQEFEFEQHDKTGQLAVMVMVSGWIEDEEDYKRAFGVLPSRMGLRERLMRFYRLHCPDRMHTVEQDVELYGADPEQLFAKLRTQFGKDPMSSCDLSPPYPIPENIPLFEQFINECITQSNSRTGANGSDWTQHETTGHDTEEAMFTDISALQLADKCQQPVMEEPRILSPSSSERLGDPPEPRDDCLENVLGDAPHWSWRELDICPLYELYLLRWEVKLQQDLGHSILDMLKSLSSAAIQNVLAYTVFATLATAVMWPVVLLKLTDAIDGLWTIAIERADQAGKEMAYALMKRPQGSRPVTLVGYSLGARVIFSCLKELARHLALAEETTAPNSIDKPLFKADDNDDERIGDSDSEDEGSLFEGDGAASTAKESTPVAADQSSKRLFFFSRKKASESSSSAASGDKRATSPSGLNAVDLRGLVHDVVLLGAPVSLTSKSWASVRRLVGGRLVNGYSTSDKVLGIIYRYQRFKFSVSGSSPVTATGGVENIDLSTLVLQHVDYCRKMKDILQLVDLTACCSIYGVVSPCVPSHNT